MVVKIRHGSPNGKLNSFTTQEGGEADFNINKTGSPSVGGQVVKLGSEDGSFITTDAEEYQPIGVVYNTDWNVGVQDGYEVAIITSGDAYVLLEDGTGATVGNWVKTSDTVPGRANAESAGPPGGTIVLLNAHMRELGHATESVSPGVDVLCRVHLHPN